MKYEIIKDNKPQKEISSFEDIDYIVEQPKWTFQDIILPDHVLENLEDSSAFFTNRDRLFKQFCFERFMKAGRGLAVNFYGLSGTGKSITAEAFAKQLNLNILRVNYAELQSMYVGQTSKNIYSVFRKAESENCLLFFDEADAVLSRRISNATHAADHGINMTVNTLLTLLDNFDGVTVFATNKFENYDEAFLRRILFHIEFTLPTVEMRVKLWQFHLSKNISKAVSYERIAELSEGLSGGDIRNISIRFVLKVASGKIDMLEEGFIAKQIEKYKKSNRQSKDNDMQELLDSKAFLS